MTVPINFDVQSAVGGIGATGAIIWAISKLRRILSHDGTDIAAQAAMKAAMEGLQGENSRLHSEILRLQTEITRLQGVVSTLTSQLVEVNAYMKQNSLVDQMARDGKIDRRKERDPFDPFNSQTKPGPLPQVDGMSAA